MDVPDVRQWFAAYLADFAALGRGDVDDAGRLLRYYGVPLLLSAAASSVVLLDEAQVLAWCRRQADDLRADGYDRSEQLSAETVVLNSSCAMHRAHLSRLRVDGSEIARLQATYVIADAQIGRRIHALVVHSPP